MKRETVYDYDNASRLTSLNHRKVSNNSVILGYTATYDAASRLTQAVESPNAATTTYAYDNANRLTSEDRTGVNAYLSDYTYDSRGLRATAFRSEGGVTSHDGTYTYDAASRLTQVVEEADGPTSYENYTWNNDSTLAYAGAPETGPTSLRLPMPSVSDLRVRSAARCRRNHRRQIAVEAQGTA